MTIRAMHIDFLPLVEKAWSMDVDGNPMLRVMKKLKGFCYSNMEFRLFW